MSTETHQYQLRITSSELTIKPYFGYMPKVKIFGLLSVLIFCIVPFSDYLNYPISDTFNNGKKSQAREAEYIEYVLNPIYKFINTQ
ncbi:hypothetical protein [Chryseobacterium populi]|uniref:Uncharacterized protein n=1 Tax=Chryseobacterium populi TaxID=1144316 RepID=J2K4V3_9FLAO|nr:hypothetical protein [Chryseobacterium populi]EJL68293.1 hypothetical protein PMI13_03821 [Chryseobacterium populi]